MTPPLTVKQTAERLAVDPRAILAAIESGDLQAANVGRGKVKPRWRITETAIEDFMILRTRPLAIAKAPKRTRPRVASIL